MERHIPEHHDHKVAIAVIVGFVVLLLVVGLLIGGYFLFWRKDGDIIPTNLGDSTGSFGATGTQDIGRDYTSLKLKESGKPWTNPGVYKGGEYTCPVDGMYYFSMTGWSLEPSGGNLTLSFRIREKKSGTNLAVTQVSGSLGASCTASYVKLKAGDKVEYQVSQNSSDNTLKFTGYIFAMLISKF